MKCKSKLYYLFSVLLAFVLLLSPIYMIGGRAEEVEPTPTNSPDNIFEYTEDYVRRNFNALCRYVVKQNAIISDGIIGTWNNFTTWLDSSGNGDIWEQHPHSPIRTNGDVEVPEEVLQVINEYVVYQIQANPLTYTDCTISSYNFLDPTSFPNFNMYKAVKDYMGSHEGYHVIEYVGTNYGAMTQIRIGTVSHDNNLGFVGTTNQGIFTQVRLYKDWVLNYSVPNMVTFNASGTITNSNYNGNFNYNLYNGTSATVGYIFTSFPKNEHVYVFNNLNAYKNFNTGMPQQYYLTTEGIGTSMSNWQVGSGTINTGTLSNANSTYSSVTNNVQSGWTADEVLALVDMISKNGGSGNGGSGSDSDNDGWLDLGIFGDIGKAIAKVIGAIITAIASIFEEIIGIVTQVSDTLLQGVIFEFLSAFIGWLPDEIIALLTALFSVAVLFALVKLIREAF